MERVRRRRPVANADEIPGDFTMDLRPELAVQERLFHRGLVSRHAAVCHFVYDHVKKARRSRNTKTKTKSKKRMRGGNPTYTTIFSGLSEEAKRLKYFDYYFYPGYFTNIFKPAQPTFVRLHYFKYDPEEGKAITLADI